MQSLLQRGLNVDEPLPLDVTVGSNDMRHDLARAADTEIPRWYFIQGAETSNDKILHVFTDSSMTAYGAWAYVVSENKSTLMMARKRVAPQKHITIPRLELMAAVIGARLCDHNMRNLECARVYLWSDSHIVLRWLISEKKHPIFINNRFREIRELTETYEWRYCPTESNPAYYQGD